MPGVGLGRSIVALVLTVVVSVDFAGIAFAECLTALAVKVLGAA